MQSFFSVYFSCYSIVVNKLVVRNCYFFSIKFHVTLSDFFKMKKKMKSLKFFNCVKTLKVSRLKHFVNGAQTFRNNSTFFLTFR